MSYTNQAYNSRDGVDAKIQQNQAQVRDLTNIMHQNIELAMQRDINLNALDTNIQDLEVNAGEFRTIARKTKRWYIWKNRKWTMILALVVIIIVLLLCLAIGLGVGLSKKN